MTINLFRRIALAQGLLPEATPAPPPAPRAETQTAPPREQIPPAQAAPAGA